MKTETLSTILGCFNVNSLMSPIRSGTVLRLLIHPFLAIPCFAGAFFGAVVKGAEPAVPWHFLVAVVAFIITVVERVVECAEFQLAFVFHEQGLIAGVGHGRAWGEVHNMKGDVDGTAWQNPVNAQRCEVEEVFNGVHREP